MKLKTIVAVILLISVLASCKKSDKAPGASMRIVGEWAIHNFMIVNDTIGKPRKSNELPTLNYSSISLQQDGHWTAPGTKGGTWMANGNTLQINNENGTRIILTVLKTDSMLVMEQQYGPKEHLAGGTIYYTFLKQSIFRNIHH
jgi:hypothetical protein